MTFDFVTYHCNTFNNFYLLKNLINSFDACNVRLNNFEWIVTDYGSTDETRDYLSDLSKERENFTIVLSNENNFANFLKNKDLQPRNRQQMKQVVFARSRNICRSIAQGNIFVDVSDDHQFVRKGDWIADFKSICDDRKQKTGNDDVATLIYRGLSYGRVMKPNNRTYAKQLTKDNVEYYVCIEKKYDDYHIMSKKKFKLINRFKQIDDVLDQNVIEDWKTGSAKFNHYIDSLDRYKKLNQQKIFLKYPYAVEFPNSFQSKNFKNIEGLIFPVVDSNELKTKFDNIHRPISTDEIFHAFSHNIV